MKDTDRKEQIRQRYKGISIDALEIIPAIPQESFFNDNSEKRVAIYARVSTDDARQTSSYELQKNHYRDVVSQHPGWTLIEIYADEGISGTSLRHRDAFIRMIDDCKSGKFDLIVTKSVSRFARNVVDCIGYVRQLAALTPPVGIFFETEGIYTLDAKSEIGLSFISIFAQEESRIRSEVMNASIEMRFRRGLFLTPALLGYNRDEDGGLVINEEEARTVRLIFFMYLFGYTCRQIAITLTQLLRRTKKSNVTWSASTVLSILQNERHCGDILARKTYTENYLDHKSKKNRRNRNQYRQENHHEAIISREDFIAVQRLIQNARYGYRGFLPKLQVIPAGALCGCVIVHPKWSGFHAEDYCLASSSVTKAMPHSLPHQSCADSNTFDWQGYEVVRSQFFDTRNRIILTFSHQFMRFNADCVQRFQTDYIEMLVHPDKNLFVLRPSAKENRNAVQWAKERDGRTIPKQVSGRAFLPNLYKLFRWNPEYKYRLFGIKKQIAEEELILFHLKEAQVLVPISSITEADRQTALKPFGAKNDILAYPPEWNSSFGERYDMQQQMPDFIAACQPQKQKSKTDSIPYNPEPLDVTDELELEKTIKAFIYSMRQEVSHE
ncbi:MAG: recombinase family protein [Lachnospiraceae bacterium]|nr:recombinase family protein [Lachnospiraceae bacterium]